MKDVGELKVLNQKLLIDNQELHEGRQVHKPFLLFIMRISFNKDIMRTSIMSNYNFELDSYEGDGGTEKSKP